MENQNNQQNQPQPPSLSNSDYTKFDEKTIATIKASAIWNTVSVVIMSVAGMLAAYYFTRNLYSNMMGPYGQYLSNYMGQSLAPKMINIGVLVNDVVWGIIGGAISGYVIAKFYPVFVGWQKKYTGDKLNNFFKILFWPYLVGLAISMVVTGALSSLYSGFSSFFIVILADLAAVYLYARMMDKAVGKYYK